VNLKALCLIFRDPAHSNYLCSGKYVISLKVIASCSCKV